MDPSNYPNPNSADDDMPMFGGGGGGGAHWPGHEDYRVETPGSVGSTYVEESEFDPFFNTDSYPIEDMEPSCGQPSTDPEPTRRKKRMARKDKAPAVPLASNDAYAEGRTDYSQEEYMKVAMCWVDITEDSINANHQTSARMWDRIAARYNEVKPKWAYKRTKEQLRKCWDRIKKPVNRFRDIYVKLRDGRASGESMEDVIQKAMAEYQSQHGQFKFYDIWLLLKDKPKFDGGIPVASSAPKRTKNTASGGYTSSGGPSPMDLNAEPEGSSGTPTSTFRRPVGSKTAKAQARGKSRASASAEPPPPPPSTQLVASAMQEFGGFRESYEYRFILDATNSLNNTTDPAARRRLEKMIANLSKKLDLDD